MRRLLLPQLFLLLGTFVVLAVAAWRWLRRYRPWWSRYSERRWLGRTLMVVDLAVAYVALSFSLLLMPFKQAPFVHGRWIGGAMLTLLVQPREIVWMLAPPRSWMLAPPRR